MQESDGKFITHEALVKMEAEALRTVLLSISQGQGVAVYHRDQLRSYPIGEMHS